MVGCNQDSDAWDNINIPSFNAPLSAIFGLWDDLNPINDNCNSYCSGNVYTYGNSDYFVIWFDNVAHWWTNFEDSYYDFQIVLYKNGDIDINYNSIIGAYDATVGMQNTNGTDGLQVGFGSTFLSNNKSIYIRPEIDWLAIEGDDSGELLFGESKIHNFSIDTDYVIDIYIGICMLMRTFVT